MFFACLHQLEINFVVAWIDFFRKQAYAGMAKLQFRTFFKQKTAYEILSGLVGSEMCIRDSSSSIVPI